MAVTHLEAFLGVALLLEQQIALSAGDGDAAVDLGGLGLPGRLLRPDLAQLASQPLHLPLNPLAHPRQLLNMRLTDLLSLHFSDLLESRLRLIGSMDNLLTPILRSNISHLITVEILILSNVTQFNPLLRRLLSSGIFMNGLHKDSMK